MAEKLTPPTGHNSEAGKGQFLAFFREAGAAKRELEELQGKYRSILKRAKSEGVNTKQLVAAMALRKQDPDDVAKDQRDLVNYMRWIGLPIGSQAELFGDGDADENTTDTEDYAQRLWEVHEAGYAAGKNGQKPEDNPHEAGSEFHQTWAMALGKGQEAARFINPAGVETVAAPKRGRGRPKKNDDGESVH